MREEDVGATLISILSEGLYTNPLHAIREYVQNSIDAGAHEVIIKMTGNTVIVRDDGCGMNLEELRQARQVGISRKEYAQFVGFRGIGIYSGFGLCNRLVIVTQKAGEDKQYTLIFDFEGMRRQITEERKDRSKTMALTELIYRYSWFEEASGNPTQHYTIVHLLDIGRPHFDQLYNVEKLRQYLLRNVPVDFHLAFPYREEIVQQLSRLPGYRASQIRIQADGQEDVLVVKPLIPNLAPPKTGYLTHNNKEIAFYWWCRHIYPERIPEEYASYRGLVYKLKGFTIGSNALLRGYFRRGGGILHDWITGEIYVLDEEIVPNAERDDFQASQAKEILTNKVRELVEEVERDVDRWRTEVRARKVIDTARESIRAVQEKLDTQEFSTEEYWDLRETVRSAEESIKKQMRSLPFPEREDAHALKRQAENLRERIQRKIASVHPAGERRGRSISVALPSTQASLVQTSLTLPATEPSLIQTIQESGWEIPTGVERLFTIIDRALKELLNRESYQNILKHISERLEEE